MIAGTIVLDGNAVFIRRDDGITPNVYVHVSIARRGGLVEPFVEGTRVGCEITRDAVGNVCALKVVALASGEGERPVALRLDNKPEQPVRVGVRLSPGQLQALIELGWIVEGCGDRRVIRRAIGRLVKEVIDRRLGAPASPRGSARLGRARSPAPSGHGGPDAA